MEKNKIDQRLAGLTHEARQPPLAIEADVTLDTKARKRTKDAAADRAKHGDSSSAKKIAAGPMTFTIFGMKAESPALPLRDDALADKGAAVRKSCLSPVDMRTLTAAGGFLLTGTASTATGLIVHQPRLWFCPTKIR